MERGSSFENLRRLAHCLEHLEARAARRLVVRLRATAMPLLLRELAAECPRRAEQARGLLFELAQDDDELRPRAIRGLLELTGAACDRTRTAALGLLRELGAGAASPAFKDPDEVKRQSARALAEQLDCEADVAATADLMAKRLDSDELVVLLELMSEQAPAQAARLAHELGVRMDLDGSLRSEVRRIAAWRHLPEQSGAAGSQPGAPDRVERDAGLARRPGGPARAGSGRAARSSRAAPAASVALLADDHGAQVVVAVRRHPAQRRWRRLTVLIDAGGVIEECLYDDDVPAVELGALEAAPLARGLLLEGYRAVSAELAAVRALVAAAAQRAAVVPQRLSSAYYLGRDLLDLGDLHLGPRAGGGALETAIGRAVDLFALGDVTRARELASACGQMAPDNADVASTLGLCLLAAGELSAATEWLTRAAVAEPNWPMHHWNLAAAHHRADRPEACAQALAGFLAANERADAVLHDDTHAERLALARRYLASHPPLAPARPRTRKPRRPRRLAADPARTRRD